MWRRSSALDLRRTYSVHDLSSSRIYATHLYATWHGHGRRCCQISSPLPPNTQSGFYNDSQTNNTGLLPIGNGSLSVYTLSATILDDIRQLNHSFDFLEFAKSCCRQICHFCDCLGVQHGRISSLAIPQYDTERGRDYRFIPTSAHYVEEKAKNEFAAEAASVFFPGRSVTQREPIRRYITIRPYLTVDVREDRFATPLVGSSARHSFRPIDRRQPLVFCDTRRGV
uniref:Uncharacterized protein n=1 Tax=Plectus sambesii TaxID=2011161 RepID=A0A914W275_9BILA